jgi:hypothetical protein
MNTRKTTSATTRRQDLLKALSDSHWNLQKVRADTGLSTHEIASYLQQGGLSLDQLVIWRSADAEIAEKVLALRHKALGVVDDSLGPEHQPAIRLKAAQTALDYSLNISERVQLHAEAESLREKLERQAAK